MNRIALINCFFGKRFPDYFAQFLISCKHNPSIDFFIFTNIKTNYTISNVHFIYYLSLDEFNILASRKLNLNINVLDAYKLCDFKPAYGKIFEDFLTDFDFWGYCDIDLIFGNIRSLITDELLENFDVISPLEKYPAGFFTLYKNTERISSIYSTSKDYKKVLQSNRHFCFDECNFRFGELLRENKDINEIETEVESLALILSKLEKAGKIKYFHKTIVQEFSYDNSVHCWDDGRIYDCDTKNEYLLIHLINVKNNINFIIKKVNKNQGLFFISPNGINNKYNDNLFYNIKLLKRKFKQYIEKNKWCFLNYIQFHNFINTDYTFLHKKGYKIGAQHIEFYSQNKNRVIIISNNNGVMFYDECYFSKIRNNTFLSYNKNKKLMSYVNFYYENNIAYKITIKNIGQSETENAYLVN